MVGVELLGGSQYKEKGFTKYYEISGSTWDFFPLFMEGKKWGYYRVKYFKTLKYFKDI